MQPNILEMMQNDGSVLNHAAHTNGGEFKGPCPWCGGDDRFTVWPIMGKYICRKCDKSGDAIQYLRDFRNMTYFEACAAAGVEPEIREKVFGLSSKPIEWKPREVRPVSVDWQTRATAFLFGAFKNLMSGTCKPRREWLNNRGIKNETIKACRLGWNPRSVSFDRASWGLPVENGKNGKPKSVWIPEGLIIPYFEDGKLVRLRIRQENPTTSDRYILVPGSSMAFFNHAGSVFDKERPSMVDESELDGILVQQEAGELVNVFSIGNSTARPDQATHGMLIRCPWVFASLDCDDAGAKETKWWVKQYDARVWTVPAGKDPGEAVEEFGVNIKTWVQAGIDSLTCKPVDGTPIIPEIEKPTNDTEDKIPAIIRTFDTQAPEKVEAIPTHTHEELMDDKACVGGYCGSAKTTHKRLAEYQGQPELDMYSLNCLVAKERIDDLQACPRGRWERRPLCGSEFVSCYVMMPRKRKRR